MSGATTTKPTNIVKENNRIYVTYSTRKSQLIEYDMELSSPPSPPPLPSSAFSENIHVPHTDSIEPRYCTTIECNNNDNNVSSILINSNSENHCADSNDSMRVNERSAYETVAVNGNTHDFRSTDDDDYSADDQSNIKNGFASAANDVTGYDSMAASGVNLLQNHFDDNAIDNDLSRTSTPHEQESNAGEEHFASASSNVTSHSNEINEHSVENNTPRGDEIVANIPTPSAICHESDIIVATEENQCDENGTGQHYVDNDAEAEDEDEEEAIFHFLGKANEIVRLYFI